MEQNHRTNLPEGMSFLGDVSNEWEKFKRRFRFEESDKLEVVSLLNRMGEEATEIFTPEESKDTYSDVIRKFDEYCKPRKNVVLNRFQFFSRAQEAGESVDDYVNELRKLASECSFENQTDSLIRDRIILGISDKKVQRRLLRESDLQLPQAIDFCRANEVGQLQTKESQRIGEEAVTSAIAVQIKKENVPETQYNSCIKREVEEILDLHHSLDVKEEASVVERNGATGGNLFTCDICGCKFEQKGTLKVHLRTHTGEKPFRCEICNCNFTRKGELTVHLRMHTGEKPFLCKVCDRKFTQKRNLIQHLKTHTKPFKCEICNYKCARKTSLEIHLTTHTSEKLFTCEICDFTTAYQGNLKTHVRTHTGQKSFTCEICDSIFTDQDSFKSHIRTHTDDKPFTCELCGYKCSRKFSLQIHSRICKYI